MGSKKNISVASNATKAKPTSTTGSDKNQNQKANISSAAPKSEKRSRDVDSDVNSDAEQLDEGDSSDVNSRSDL